MKFTVGGESYEFESEDVEKAMRGQAPEMIHKYAVDVGGMAYPPKQVFASMTGRDRQSFTTMEAQRVLGRLGYETRGGGARAGGTRRTVMFQPRPEFMQSDSSEASEPVSEISSELATIKLAIAELNRRVEALEKR